MAPLCPWCRSPARNKRRARGWRSSTALRYRKGRAVGLTHLLQPSLPADARAPAWPAAAPRSPWGITDTGARMSAPKALQSQSPSFPPKTTVFLLLPFLIQEQILSTYAVLGTGGDGGNLDSFYTSCSC